MSGKILKTIIAVLVFFFSYNVEAVSPAQPILPSDNIQDPGSPSTPWGGCGPADANCYVTTTTGPSFSEAVDGLEYEPTTGILSLTSGYVIPTSASVDAWNGLVSDSSNFIRQGGNILGTALVIGTGDANSLSFMTDGAERLTVAANGFVGVNNSNPNYTLDVSGDVNVTGALYGQGGNWYIDNSGFFSGTASVANYAGYITATGNSDFNGFNVLNVGALSATSISLTNGLPVASGGTGATSFATGRILFGNGTSAINSNSTLFWDNANGRLAIGTTTPLGKLDVSGSSASTNLVAFDSNRSISVINTNTTANNAQGIALRSVSTNGTIQSGVKLLGVNTARSTSGLTTDFAILTNSNGTISEKMRVTSGGNVGIGTTTPAARLSIETASSGNIAFMSSIQSATVGGNISALTDASGRTALVVNGGYGSAGSASAQGGAYFTANGFEEAWFDVQARSNTAGQRNMRFGNLSNRFSVQLLNDAANAIVSTPFSIDNIAPTNTMFLSSLGRTGLGTNTPSNRLTVSGVADITSGLVIGTTTLDTGKRLQIEGDFGTSAGSGIKLRNTNSGGYSELVFNNDNNRADGGLVLGMAGSTVGAGLSNESYLASRIGGLSFWTGTSGSTRRMTIDSAGNVGVGTSTPGTNFVVAGNVANNQVAATVNNSNGTGYAAFRLGPSAAVAAGLALQQFNASWPGSGAYTQNSATISAFETGGLNLHADNAASGIIRFYTGGNAASNERARIDVSGNLGIGATSVTSRLDVLHTADAATGVAVRNLSAGTSAYTTLRFANDTINGAGMFLNSSARTVDGGAGGFSFYNDAGQIRFRSSGNTAFSTGAWPGTDRLVINSSSGSIGLGTATPGAPLHILSSTTTVDMFRLQNSAAAGYSSIGFFDNGGTQRGSFGYGNASAGSYASMTFLQASAGIPLAFGAGGAERLRIDSSGNVGIGTTTPADRLSVQGNINLTGALEANGDAGTLGMVLRSTGTGLQWTATSSLGIVADITSLAVISGGRTNTVTGTNGVAFGLSNYNPASNGVAFGISNTIATSSIHSTVIGTANTVGSIGYSTVVGRANTANSQQSTVVGIGNSAPTDYSTVIGSSNLVFGSGIAHIAFGDTNTINPGGASRAAAIGHNNTVNAGGAYVFGNTITNSTSNSVMIGPSDSAKLTILSNGNLGIGTTTPGQKLTVVGNAQFTSVGSGAYGFDLNLTADGVLTTSASDERLKENVMLINSSSTLEKINQLKPSTFDWKSDGSHDLGLIAQEVQTIFPELVFTNPSDGYLGINYSRFTPLLISAIQELSRKVDGIFAWFKDGKFNIQSDVCVDDVCVTKEQFKNMLRNAGGQQASVIQEATPPTTPPEDNSTSTEEDVTPPAPEANPTPVVEPAPEPTPAPVETVAEISAPASE